jgi:DNA-binding PadR family transcriptional regulator
VENRVRFKIGEIEFEAEGSAEILERERSVFLNTLLPAAIDAIVRTRGEVQPTQRVEAVEQPAKLLAEDVTADTIDTTPIHREYDYSPMNLASFLNNFGKMTEQDFALFAAYFDEKKNNKNYFTINDLEMYYAEARRKMPSNISMSLYRLAKKGLIMDVKNAEHNKPKPYKLSDDGIKYIEKYKPKKEIYKKVQKPRKSRPKAKSAYSDINLDELNLGCYSEVESLKDFKEKMMMVLYIVTNEKKGEWFTVADVLYLMTDIFGETATKGQVNGIEYNNVCNLYVDMESHRALR